MGKYVRTEKSVDSVPSAQESINQNMFMGTMLNISMQMALVVLLPTIGGYQLDTHFDTSPYLTFLGLLIAIGGMVLVITRAVKDLNAYMASVTKPEDKNDK